MFDRTHLAPPADDLAACRGIVRGVALGLALWLVLGALVWWWG